MATLRPFRALRPKPELAARICELPYDVMSADEARAMAEGNPLSFLRVSRPEIELPPGTDPYSPAVYQRGRENFQKLIAQGALFREATPCFYLYRQVMGTHAQTGFVAVASCQEYLDGIVKKHELTRPDKEDDRVRHIETLNAQTGPVFLTYRSVPALETFLARATASEPVVDFTAPDGVRHSAWVIHQPADMTFIQQQFEQVPGLYIADGHHRSAAAARVFQARGGRGGSGVFLTVTFPHNQMQVLPYNRVVKDLHGLTPAQLLAKLDAVFVIQPEGSPRPARKHMLALFLDGRWYSLTFRPPFAATTDPVEGLDVSLLQKYVLDPILGIADPRTSQRIQFVGGIRGTGELEKLVRSGRFACAFSLFPTSVEDLMQVADAGGIMPPKSTWFEPKLRDAMFCHLLD
jgi:uncharacterized protein (DUF1015 family)